MQYAAQLAETIMKRHPEAKDYPYKPWSYPQAFMLWGMEALYRQTGDPVYEEYILAYCRHHVDEAGKVAAFTGDSMDDMMCGSILVWAWQHTGEARYETACRHIRAAFDTYPRTRDGGFWHAKRLPGEIWVDGVFMGQMFLSKYAAAFPEAQQDFNEAVRQLQCIYRYCNKQDSGLLLHAWSEDGRPTWADPVTGLSPEVWSEGLGWYALILPQVLETMPPDWPGRKELLQQYRQLLEGLLRTQCWDGLWCQVVDKCEQPDNWTDSSGSAMFFYAIQQAIETGVVSGDAYEQMARNAYQGLLGRLKPSDIDGLLDIPEACKGLCVQDDYAAYVNYPKKVNAQEAVAAMLWALAATENMAE